jgi:hypothetical protein
MASRQPAFFRRGSGSSVYTRRPHLEWQPAANPAKRDSMKTSHALGLVVLAVAATLAIEESRIARMRETQQPVTAGGGPASTRTPGLNSAAGDGPSAPKKTNREAKTAASRPAPDEEDGESFGKTVRKMWDNPAGKAMMNQGVKVAVAMMYEDFIAGLDLTKDEADYIKTLLGKEISDQQEVGMKFLSATAEERTALGEEMEMRKKENEEAIKTFLNNEEDYKNYSAYRDRLPERQQLDGIRAVMSSKNASLDPQTEGLLIDAMYNARTQTDAPDYSGPKAFEELSKGNVVENFEMAWNKQEEKLMAQTRGILTEAQQEAFNEYRKQAKDMQLMGIKMAEKMMSEKEEPAR